MYEIWGAEPCAVQKATGPSGDQNKRQNWAIVSICCPGERERRRGREGEGERVRKRERYGQIQTNRT